MSVDWIKYVFEYFSERKGVFFQRFGFSFPKMSNVWKSFILTTGNHQQSALILLACKPRKTFAIAICTVWFSGFPDPLRTAQVAPCSGLTKDEAGWCGRWIAVAASGLCPCCAVWNSEWEAGLFYLTCKMSIFYLHLCKFVPHKQSSSECLGLLLLLLDWMPLIFLSIWGNWIAVLVEFECLSSLSIFEKPRLIHWLSVMSSISYIFFMDFYFLCV